MTKPDLENVLGHYGVELPTYRSPSGIKVKCGFHSDANASAAFYETKQRYICYACGAGGDAWDIIQQQEGCTFPEAKAFAAEQGWVEVGPDGHIFTQAATPKAPARQGRAGRRRRARR